MFNYNNVSLKILLILGMGYVSVLFNSWYNLFYDALQNKARAAFYQQLWRFCRPFIWPNQTASVDQAAV